MSLSKSLGGYVTDTACSSCDAEGGESGLSTLRGDGRGPGEQKGKCLLGTGAGVPRGEVLIDSCGGGVAVRPGAGAALVQTVVAITFVCNAVSRSTD